MGNGEFGKCEICGKDAILERTYFYYPIHCECCESYDKNAQRQHFEIYVIVKIAYHVYRKKFIHF